MATTLVAFSTRSTLIVHASGLARSRDGPKQLRNSLTVIQVAANPGFPGRRRAIGSSKLAEGEGFEPFDRDLSPYKRFSKPSGQE